MVFEAYQEKSWTSYVKIAGNICMKTISLFILDIISHGSIFIWHLDINSHKILSFAFKTKCSLQNNIHDLYSFKGCSPRKRLELQVLLWTVEPGLFTWMEILANGWDFYPWKLQTQKQFKACPAGCSPEVHMHRIWRNIRLLLNPWITVLNCVIVRSV